MVSTGHTFVLVHGAWHGSWCWARVAAHLREQGNRVYAPTLTGLGERSHLASDAVNLTTHVTDVTNEILWKDLDHVVLCGHSYGGMVITGVLERVPERIAAVVYLDAFLPADGQCLNEIVGASRPTRGVLPAPTAELFAVNEVDAPWVQTKLTPQPAATFAERITLTGALERVPSRTFVLARRKTAPFLRAICDSLRTSPGWRIIELDGGHDLMIDAPRDTADALMRSVTPN